MYCDFELEEKWKGCQRVEEQNLLEMCTLSFSGCMKNFGKVVKVLKSKTFHMYTLIFSECMKKNGKHLAVLKNNIFEMCTLSFLGCMKNIGKVVKVFEERNPSDLLFELLGVHRANWKGRQSVEEQNL